MKNEKQTAGRFRTFAIGCCLCLLAAGAGVAYKGLYEEPTEQSMEEHQPVTAVQTPPLDTAILNREKQSNDDGEAPDSGEKTKESKAEPKKADTKQPLSEKEMTFLKQRYTGDNLAKLLDFYKIERLDDIDPEVARNLIKQIVARAKKAKEEQNNG